MIPSTMQDFPLTIDRDPAARSTRATATASASPGRSDGPRSATFAEVGDAPIAWRRRSRSSASQHGDRVGTFCWNTQEHLEAYFAVPSMGAVLHTLNIRLFPEQLAYVINHAEDQVIIVDDSARPAARAVVAELKTVEHFIVVGDGDASAARATRRTCCATTSCSPRSRPGFAWPEIDERAAAAMCYTSGTTGNPKGVAYSHRSTYLHSLAVTTPRGASALVRARPRAGDRADVPRQRVGPAVRGVHRRRDPADARALPAGRAAHAR